MKNLLKPTLSLFLICLFTTLALALVFQITAPQIQARTLADQQALQREVLPEAERFEALQDFSAKDAGGAVREAFIAEKSGQPNGYVFIIEVAGYGGPVRVMLGVTKELSIGGLRLISNSETPGLGANAASPAFYERFNGKKGAPPLEVVKAGMGSGKAEEIDAIASATITSRAVAKAAQAGLDLAAALSTGGGK